MNTAETESIRHQAKIAALPLVENRAAAETAQTLRDEMLYHRATQTYLWALPGTVGRAGAAQRRRASGSEAPDPVVRGYDAPDDDPDGVHATTHDGQRCGIEFCERYVS